jgi:hypothetical protein
MWYTGSVTFDHPDGISGDVVIENCPVPTVVLPVVERDDINIVGTWFQLDPGNPDIKTDYRVRGTGNDICGATRVCSGEGIDSNWYCHTLRWRMLDDLETMEFVVQNQSLNPFCESHFVVNASVEVSWGTGPNGTGVADWFDDDNMPIIVPGAGGYWKLERVADCGQPPGPCDVENACWPDLCPCLVDGSNGEIYRTIYADVSGDHTETELPLEPNDAAGLYQWTRGADAITILCQNGGLDDYMVTVILGADSYFCSIPAGGLQCDGIDLVDETVICGDITLRLYTL